MFEDVVQLVLRNTGSQGYETIYSSSNVEIDNDLLPYILPRSKTSVDYSNYFFKLPINQDFTLVKLVQDDGVDAYNRFKAKVILFIIPNQIYEKVGGLLFFASPLWKKTIKMDTNEPLSYETDFSSQEEIEKNTAQYNNIYNECLLDKLLLYNNLYVKIPLTNGINEKRIALMKSLAYLDLKLPTFFRNQVSFKTLAHKMNGDLANCLVLYDYKDEEIIDNQKSYTVEYLEKKKDELPIEGGTLAKKILDCKTIPEREAITKLLSDSKTIQKEEIMPGVKYNQLIQRYGMKDSKFIDRFFKNFILR